MAVRWFIEEEAHPHADEVLERVIDEPTGFAAPELFAFGLFSVLQRIYPSGLEAFRKGIMPSFKAGYSGSLRLKVLHLKQIV